VKPTSLLFFMIGTILLFGLAQMMANSIFHVSPLPMTSAASERKCSKCIAHRVMTEMRKALQART
jgi:hypothetical protein